MFGVEGQYIVKFDIGDQKDFLKEDDFATCTVIEEAGNKLPSFELAFNSDSSALLSKVNEGNIINMSLGKTPENMVDIPLRVLSRNTPKQGDSKQAVLLAGLRDNLDYASGGTINITDKMSGVEAIKETVSKHFTPKFNIDKSQDSQNWVQPNVSDMKFIRDTWLHSYVNKSFIAVGITTGGEFILKDIRKEIHNEPLWNFVVERSDDARDIVYDRDYAPNVKTGFLNKIIGYGKSRHLKDLDSGAASVANPTAEPLITLSSALDRASSVAGSTPAHGLLNGNVHSKYWDAYHLNVSYLALFNTSSIVLSFQNEMKDIKVLDLALFEDFEIDSPMKSEQVSGLYFVTKVARTISSRKIITVVELNREVSGAMRGEFL